MSAEPEHLDLAGLIGALERADPTQIVPLGFGHPHSYRGDYSELAFEVRRDVSVADMLADACSARGTTYEGWKGGLYEMDSVTPVWLVQRRGDLGETLGAVLLAFMLGGPAKELSSEGQPRLCICGHHPNAGDGSCPVVDCGCTGYQPQPDGPQTIRVVESVEVCDGCAAKVEATVSTLVAERDAARTGLTEVEAALTEVDAALAEWAIAREEVPAELWQQVAAMWDDLQAARADNRESLRLRERAAGLLYERDRAREALRGAQAEWVASATALIGLRRRVLVIADHIEQSCAGPLLDGLERQALTAVPARLRDASDTYPYGHVQGAPGGTSEVLAAISDWIDRSPSYVGLDLEAHLVRRVVKVCSEAGEVVDALYGSLGENPRKGVTHTSADLVRELLDVATAALGAVEHIGGNSGGALVLLDQHIRAVAARAVPHGLVLPAEPTEAATEAGEG